MVTGVNHVLTVNINQVTVTTVNHARLGQLHAHHLRSMRRPLHRPSKTVSVRTKSANAMEARALQGRNVPNTTTPNAHLATTVST